MDKHKLVKISQVIEPLVNILNSLGNQPIDLAKGVNEQYRLLERQVNELALASGMSDDQYKSIRNNLVQKGAGTEIQVLKMLQNIFLTLKNKINFQDPTNLNAIFGSMSVVTDNLGREGLLSWVNDRLLPIINQTVEMGLNPKQITNFISNNVAGTIGTNVIEKFIDPRTNQEVPFVDIIKLSNGDVINKNTGQKLIQQNTIVDTGKNQEDLMNIGQAALAKGSQNWEDLIGWKGDTLKKTMDYTQGLRNTTTPITLTPTDQQRLQALMSRELTGLEQEKLRLLLGLESGISPYTMMGIEDARKAIENMAKIAPYSGKIPGVNLIPQISTTISESIGGTTTDLLNPQKALQQIGEMPQKKASRNKLTKIAQINNTYTYNIDPNAKQNKFNPQPQSGVYNWAHNVGQADITSTAAEQARMLEFASIVGMDLAGQIMQAENKANMLNQHLTQFQAGLSNIDQLQRQGITDETIVQQMVPMMQELEMTYITLLGDDKSKIKGLYQQASEQIDTNIQTATKGDPALMVGVISKLQGFKSELNAKIQDFVYKKQMLNMDMVTIENRMKQKLQESEVSDTLQKITDLYGKTWGATLGRGELAASQTAEGQYLLDAAEQANKLGKGISPVMRARLQQKGLEKIQEALNNLEASGKSSTNPSETISMTGL